MAQSITCNLDELLEWAAGEIGRPVRRIIEVAEQISRGKKLTHHEALVKLPLSRIEVDYRGIYPLLRDLMPILAFEPAHLLVLILDSDGNIKSARFLTTRDNSYVAIEDISVKEEWAGIATSLIRSGERDNLRHELDEWFRKAHRPEINCVIAVRPEGLGAIRDGWEAFKSKGKGYFSFVYKTLGKCIEQDWIIFDQLPRLIARLNDIYNIVDAPEGAMSEIFGADAFPARIAVALWGRDYVTGFLYTSDNSARFGINADVLSMEDGQAKLAKALKRETQATFAFVLHADMAINLLHELLNRPIPTAGNDSKVLLRKILYFIRGYKSLWWIHPTPIPLKNYVRMPIRALGLPYDLTRLSWWFLPDLMIDGMGMLMGDVIRFAVIILDGDKPRGVILVDIFNRGLKKITLVPADELKEIFADAGGADILVRQRRKALRNRLIKAKHYIWDKYGWVDWANAVQIETLMHARKLVLGGYMDSLLKAPLAMPTWYKLKKSLARGGLVVYPNMMFEESAKYAKEVGVHKIRRNMLKLPFDAYRPQTRGPLYIRETLYIAGAVGTIIALFLWILH